MEFRYDVIQLNRLNWRDFAKKSNPVAAALMAKVNVAPSGRARVKLECLRLLVTLKLNQAKTRLISGFVDSYLKLDGEQLARFEAEVRAAPFEQKEKVMEIVTSWMEEGLRKGRKEGEREGKRKGIELGQIEATRDSILEILETRFSRVPSPIRKTLKSIEDRRRLKLLLREAVTIPTLKGFEQRLGNGQSRQRH
jgi:flagellar biosynthesis/type III secretory pathway protein FliH